MSDNSACFLTNLNRAELHLPPQVSAVPSLNFSWTWLCSGASTPPQDCRIQTQSILQETMEAAEEAGAAPEQQYSEVGSAHYAGTQYGYPPDANDFTNIDQTLDAATHPPTSKESHGPGLGDYMNISVQNGHAEVLDADSNMSASLHNATVPPATPLNPATKRKSPEDASGATPGGSDSKRKRSKVSRACDQCRKKKVNKPL